LRRSPDGTAVLFASVRSVNAPAALLAVMCAGATDAAPASHHVRARLEASPPAQAGARFAVRARLENAPDGIARVLAFEGDNPLRIDARLTARSDVASCPSPGAIFRDGFELP
jgi:hypothetical protein